MPDSVLVPTFARGTYPSMEGEPVEFTDDFMRTLERNTNFLIDSGILHPPVTYDALDDQGNYLHNSNKSTDAHGHVQRLKFANGALLFDVVPTDTLREDVKKRKRLHTSGVFTRKYWYNDADGKRVELGPAVVATTMLGNRRPAMRSPLVVPLSQLNFGESAGPVEAWETREELRAHGLVAQTFDGDKYMFSEIAIDPAQFTEQEQGMTDAEIQALIANGIKAAVTPLQATINDLTTKNAELEGNVKRFSEGAKREGDTRSFCETLVADRKQQGQALPKLFLAEGEKLLNDASFSDAQREQIKGLMKLAPAALIGTPEKKKPGEGEGDGGGDDDDPAPLAKVKLRHFANRSAHEQVLAEGLRCFSEKQPDKVKGLDFDGRMNAMQRHVQQRDLGEAQ